MDLPTQSIWKIRSSADPAGRRVTLVGMAVTSKFSNSEIREVTGAWGVRSDLTPAKTLPPTVEGPEVGVPGNRNLRETPEGKGEADCRLHLGSDADGEDDASVGCH